MSRLINLCCLSALLLAVAGCATQRPIHLIRDDADARYSANDYASAAEYYQQIVDRKPEDGPAQYRLGLCRLELNQADAARRALDVARSLRPQDDEIADALARAMFMQGAEAELFAFLRQRADVHRDARAFLQLARYSIEIGDMDSAARAILTAIEVDEGVSAEPYLAAAAFHARLGNTEAVVRRLRQAYGIAPDDERVIGRLREYGEVPGPTIALPPGR